MEAFFTMKRAFTLLELAIVVAVVALIAAMLFPVFVRSRGEHGPSCQSYVKQNGLGLLQYEQDYDERMPPVRVTASTGWADVLQPYIKSTQIFQCPQGQSTTTNYSTDYFYNRRLSRVTLSKIASPAWIIAIGDGDDDAPTWNSWAGLPADATTNASSPSQRHFEGANYGFLDGHIKWLKPDRVSSTYAAPTSRPTFAVR